MGKSDAAANAERNLKRQQDLFDQKFISQAALDTAVTQMDLLKGQLAVADSTTSPDTSALWFATLGE